MNIYILTGPVHSGKTTALRQLCSAKPGMKGILSPRINGKRYFENIGTGEQWSMEAEEGAKEALTVGRYSFSLFAFQKASEVLEQLIAGNQWIVVDEVGPLELHNQGFYTILNRMAREYSGNALLVVREGLVEKVKKHFSLNSIQIVQKHELSGL